MKVSVVGAGYVGLATGVCLAEKGHRVVCVDVDEQRVENINKGISPIHEARLEELLAGNIGVRLHATTDLHKAVIDTDLTIIAVGTPLDGGRIDLSQVRAASRQVGKALKEKATYHLVAVKSTVVPGTTDEVVLPILEEASEKKAGVDFGVAMNPEFLTEGQAIQDCMNPDRIVLGGIDEKSLEMLDELYEPFTGVDRVHTNTRTAEMIKYASNAMLATMISFSNEVANLCSALGGIDALDVMKGVHLAHYLSPILPDGTRVVAPITAFLHPGCGFGGSCLPKDVKALVAHGRQVGASMVLLDAVLTVNEQQPRRIIALLRKHFPSLAGVRITILGLSFKPDTDDIRESPAIAIIRELLPQGAIVRAYDPVANQAAQKVFRDERVIFCDDLAEALRNVDSVVLMTRWAQFEKVPELLRAAGGQPVFVDGRRMIDKDGIAGYEGIGL